MRVLARARLITAAALVLLATPAAGAGAPFPVIGKPAPNFTLTSQSGAHVQLAQFRGKLVVLDFIYTHCTDVCPLVTANLARVQRQLVARGWWITDIVFVSVTTDPARDTPGVLLMYARRYAADLHGWSFLTGSRQTLAAVYRTYGVVVRPSGAGLQAHSLPIFVISRQGIVLGAYGWDFKSQDMLADLAHLR